MEIPHIKQAIDLSNPYAALYLDVVSLPSSEAVTDTHHIVPVSFYRDVLGEDRVRMADTPDMDRRNLVKLTPGKHLLAHYYLCKCAQKCIRVQMENAFALMYSTFDISSVSDGEVMRRSVELDAEYAKIKHRKRVHKDGPETIFRNTYTILRHWKDGKQYGISAKWEPDGKLFELGDCDQDITVVIKPGWTGFSMLSENLNFTVDGRFYLTEWNNGNEPWNSRHVEAYFFEPNSVLIGHGGLPYAVDANEVKSYVAGFSERAMRLISSAPSFIELYADKNIKRYILPVLYRFIELYGTDNLFTPIAIPDMPVKHKKSTKEVA